MKELIQRVIDKCGYDCEPTEENLVELFLDYVDAGIYADLDMEEARDLIDEGEISIKSMCYNLLKVR